MINLLAFYVARDGEDMVRIFGKDAHWSFNQVQLVFTDLFLELQKSFFFGR